MPAPQRPVTAIDLMEHFRSLGDRPAEFTEVMSFCAALFAQTLVLSGYSRTASVHSALELFAHQVKRDIRTGVN
jgi:hypothetical protein